MAARVPRRSFASPFVITLAAAPACASPGGVNPPPPMTTADAEPTPETPPPAAGEGGSTPTPEPEPATDVAWTVMQNGSECTTVRKVVCPQPEAGQPMRTCNPPPPQAYECPKWDDGSPMQIDAGAWIGGTPGGERCTIHLAAPPCPAGASCNPPPPRKVPCPKV